MGKSMSQPSATKSRFPDQHEDVIGCHACCAVDGQDVQETDLETLIFALVIGGQSMVWGLAVNLTPPPLFSNVYWMLHGWLAASAIIVGISLGPPLLRTLWENLRKRRLSVEGLFLVTATGGFLASLISTFTGVGDVYYEVVAIVLAIYSFGKRVGNRTRKKIAAEVQQVEQAFHFCTLINEEGVFQRVPVDEVVIGSRVHLEAGEHVTIDGVVQSGSAWVDCSMTTGEPEPVHVGIGDSVKAGSWLRSGTLLVGVERAGGSRELDEIFDALRSALKNASQIEAWTDQLTRRFLPFVLLASGLTWVAWTLIAGWQEALFNAMAVLLVACPCALGLATPIAVWRGLVRLAGKGIVSRDVKLLDALGTTREVFWDKTGTLTQTKLEIVDVRYAPGDDFSEDALASMVATVENAFDHPMASTLKNIGEPSTTWTLNKPQWQANFGVRAQVIQPEGQAISVQIGDMAAVLGQGARLAETLAVGSLPEGKRIALCIDGVIRALFVIREALREQALETLDALELRGIRSTILTGDPDPVWGRGIGAARMHAGLSAMTKSEFVERSKDAGMNPVLIGDGINDAPGMHAASASLAMASGTSLTQAVGSGVLLNDHLSAVVDAIDISRETLKRIHSNLYFSAGYNLIGIGLASLGWLHPVVAAGLMLGSSLWVSWRAVR